MKRIPLLLIILIVGLKLAHSQNSNAFTKAVEHCNNKEFELAFPFLAETLIYEPNHEPAQRLMALCFEETGSHSRTISSYHNALALNPRQEDVWYNLSLVYANSNDYKKAIEALNRAIEINPDFSLAQKKIELFEQKALSLVGTKIPKEKTKSKELYRIPKNLSAYNQGVALQRNGVYDEALKFYKMALEKETEIKAEIYFNMGMCFFELEQLPKAVSALNKAVKENPNYGKAYLLLGNIHFELGQMEHAIDNYQSAIDEGMNIAYVFASLGTSHYYNENFKAAQNNFEQAIMRDEYNSYYHYNMALCLSRREAFLLAIPFLEKAIELNNTYAEAYYNLAFVHKEMDSFDTALEIAKELMEIQPGYAKGYLITAAIYQELGDKENQHKYYQLAKNINPAL